MHAHAGDTAGGLRKEKRQASAFYELPVKVALGYYTLIRTLNETNQMALI